MGDEGPQLPTPDPGEHDWCLARFTSSNGSYGFIEESGEIWSRDGTLLAQSRQLAIFGTEMGESAFGEGFRGGT